MEENQNDSDKENKNSVQIEECSTYPLNNEILYKERVNGRTKRSFNYVIIKEGVYSNESITGPKNKNENYQSVITELILKDDLLNNTKSHMAMW